jgi:hypothetical protein
MRVETPQEAKRGFQQPKPVHEQWHVDFSYIKKAVRFIRSGV